MFENLGDILSSLASEAYPEPAVVGAFGDRERPEILPLAGVANSSRLGFKLEMPAIRRMSGQYGPLLAILRSHPSDEPDRIDPVLLIPSAAEMRAQVALEVPFGIVPCHAERNMEPFWFGDQAPIRPLIGRVFRHGVTDCYSLIRDWYRLYRQVVLEEFPRDWDWWNAGLDLYRDGFGQAGFREIDAADVREGDVVLFRMRSKVPNHGGVFLDGDRMIHHPASSTPYDIFRLSNVQSIERWRRHATHWLRFEAP